MSTCVQAAPPPDCSRVPLDLVFVLDSSGSISDSDSNPFDQIYENWDLMLDFVVHVIDALPIGSNQTRVGVVKFGNIGYNEIFLNSYFEKQDLKDAVRRIQYSPENTNTSGGIRVMHREQFTNASGDRPGVSNMAIIMTDGQSTYDSHRTLLDAAEAMASGIQIVAIGITDAVKLEEIRGMSSPPQEEFRNWWAAPDFEALERELVQQIVDEFCRPPDSG